MKINEDKKFLLKELYNLYSDFKKTSLYIDGANSIVFGEGNIDSPLMFIGEAPGFEEDKQARPFVGRSGKLLDLALKNADIERKDVFITNIVKCRPPENRTPTNFEIEKGKNLILNYEISIINPKVIVPLGLSALKGLIPEITSISIYRGKFIKFENRLIYPIFHPAYVLRNGNMKDLFFSDIKNILKKYF